MPIYVYETVSQDPTEEPRYHEFLQGMSEEPFTKHPETGEPIRRVFLGTFGVLSSGSSSAGGGSSCCGPGSGCC